MLDAAPPPDLSCYCDTLGRRARTAARVLAAVKGEQKNAWLLRAADALETHSDPILKANALDLDAAPGQGLNSAAIDRLRLTPDRLRAAAAGLREVAVLPDPVGRVLDSNMRP